jgi:hypothetical protein
MTILKNPTAVIETVTLPADRPNLITGNINLPFDIQQIKI